MTPGARGLFGGKHQAELFNWHHDTFEILQGATRTLFGTHCLNKGFAQGRHLGFQAHLEVTEASVRAWCEESRAELGMSYDPAVQTEVQMLTGLAERTTGLHALARGVYRQWVSGLQRPKIAHPHGGW